MARGETMTAFPKIRRTAVSFFAVLAAYWAYRLVAVPFIEPSLEHKRLVTEISPETRQRARDQLENRLGGYARFFPEDAWERNDPIVLESDSAKLLLREYKNLPDGRVRLDPCTVIFLPDGEAEAADSRRRVVILQAPAGAVLQFDEKVDLGRAQIGRLLGGTLEGEITIHSGPTRPGGDDDLHVTTRDVTMIDDRVTTPHEVQFRFGPSHGRGRDMRIELLPGPETAGKRRGPNVGGIQAFELLREVQMHLQPGSGGLLPGDRRRDVAAAREIENKKQPPVDIRCQGPFRFDLVENVATFTDHVDVLRANFNGPSDQMNCELLSIFFAAKVAKPQAAVVNKPVDGEVKNSPEIVPSIALPRLEPQRIEARGNPVIVQAPSTGGAARAERLEYDIVTGRIALDAADEVMLRQQTNEARAKSISYEPGPNGTLGKLYSVGPGWLNAAPTADISRRFEARWSRELKMRPHEQNSVVSLVGSARASYTGQGEMAAEEIHLWLLETPPDPAATPRANDARSRIRPDRLLADGGVRIASPQLSGAVGRLEGWFREIVPRTTGRADDGLQRRVAGVGTKGEPAAVQRAATRASPLGGSSFGQPESSRRDHYEIDGKLLRVQLATRDSRTELEDVNLEGDAKFFQTPPERSSDIQSNATAQRPLDIAGDRLQVLRANASTTEVTVIGRPAQVSAQGLAMSGAAVRLDRGANRLWIDGAGRMTIAAAQVAPNSQPADRNLNPRGPIVVDWTGGMNFDGALARFEKHVVSQMGTQSVRTELLEVALRQRVDFNATRNTQRPEVETVACRGDVLLENRELADRDLAAIDRMATRDLVVNQRTGDLTANGPGRLLSWRRGAAGEIALRPTSGGTINSSNPAANNSNNTAASADNDRINFLDVQFARGITGNIQRRELSFHEQVRTVYGPVASWDAQLNADTASGLGPRGILLTCDKLSLVEMPRPNSNRGSVELAAEGNTLVEGDLFTARAHRLTYAEAKDLLVLEGEGRNEAELFRQPRPGAPTQKAAARKILYWRGSNRVEVDDAKFLDLSQFGPAAR